MLRAAITLFVIGLLAMFLGMYNVAGVSFELGRLLLLIFTALALVGFLVALFTGRSARPSL